MKEIVVIPKENLVYIKPKYNKMEKYIKVPENFAELIELCKNLKTDKIEIKDEHCIYVSTEHYGYLGNKLAFSNYVYSTISVVTEEYFNGEDKIDEFACDVEPKDMWAIIKSLIGAEKWK